MKLHSINQENKTAIIEHMGQITEAQYTISNGDVWLCNNSRILLENEGLSPPEVRMIISSYLASAPKHELEVPDPNANEKQYSAYKINVSDLQEADIYEIHNRFKIDDPSGCIQHSSKKLLLAGTRTGGKSKQKDIQEAIDTLRRWLQLNQ